MQIKANVGAGVKRSSRYCRCSDKMSANNEDNETAEFPMMSMEELGSKVHVCDHPVLRHKLTQLRRRETSSKHFREIMGELTMYLGYEATKGLETKSLVVDTPMAKHTGCELSSKVGLIPIMRSGLGMASAMLDIIPNAQVHHLGMYRDKRSLLPTLYYNKLPKQMDLDLGIILEPLIATSGTIIAVVEILKAWGLKEIHLISLVGSQHGLSTLLQTYPDVHIHIAAIDDKLSDQGQIIPGLGDVGDRLFATRRIDEGDSNDPDSKRQKVD